MFYPTTCVGLRYGCFGGLSIAVFLGSMITFVIRSRKRSRYCQVRLEVWICLYLSTPTPFNRQFRLPAEVSRLRPRFSPQSSTGILTRSSVGFALRLILRTRLTLIRLTLIRKPWSFGEGVSRPLSRYLYLHLLFRPLQRGSSPRLQGGRNAPLPIVRNVRSRVFGRIFMPDYYPRTVTRPVSCYALFK